MSNSLSAVSSDSNQILLIEAIATIAFRHRFSTCVVKHCGLYDIQSTKYSNLLTKTKGVPLRTRSSVKGTRPPPRNRFAKVLCVLTNMFYGIWCMLYSKLKLMWSVFAMCMFALHLKQISGQPSVSRSG